MALSVPVLLIVSPLLAVLLKLMFPAVPVGDAAVTVPEMKSGAVAAPMVMVLPASLKEKVRLPAVPLPTASAATAPVICIAPVVADAPEVKLMVAPPPLVPRFE